MSPTSESIAENVREELETLLGMVMKKARNHPLLIRWNANSGGVCWSWDGC